MMSGERSEQRKGIGRDVDGQINPLRRDLTSHCTTEPATRNTISGKKATSLPLVYYVLNSTLVPTHLANPPRLLDLYIVNERRDPIQSVEAIARLGEGPCTSNLSSSSVALFGQVRVRYEGVASA